MSRTVSQTINLQTPDQTGKYITQIDGGGIKIHDSQRQSLDYLQLTSNGIDIKQNNISLASFTTNGVAIGQSSVDHIEIKSDGFAYLYNNLPLFYIQGTEGLGGTNGACFGGIIYRNRERVFKPLGDAWRLSSDVGNPANYENHVYFDGVDVTNESSWYTFKFNIKIYSSSAYLYPPLILWFNDSCSGHIDDGNFIFDYIYDYENGTILIKNGFSDYILTGIYSLETKQCGFSLGTNISSTTSIGLGIGNNTDELNSVAIGSGNNTIGLHAFAVGSANIVLGSNAIAAGFNNKVYHNNAIAMGNGIINKGFSAVGMGYSLEIAGNNTTAIGIYNDNQSNTAFEIGNGTSDTARSNALTVDWSGNTEQQGRATTNDMSTTDIDNFVNNLNFRQSSLIDFFYPVGSYYETSDTSFDPNVTWGGTWKLETGGIVHVSAGTNYTVSGANSADGVGAKDGGDTTSATGNHTLTYEESGVPAHTHGMAHTHSHNHLSSGYIKANAAKGTHAATPVGYNNSSRDGQYTSDTDATASSKSATDNNTVKNATKAHNHGNVSTMQPYIIVNRWHRTA